MTVLERKSRKIFFSLRSTRSLETSLPGKRSLPHLLEIHLDLFSAFSCGKTDSETRSLRYLDLSVVGSKTFIFMYF